MLIAITASNANNSNTRTAEFSEDAALKLARDAIRSLQPMEETSIDLMAMKLIKDVTDGKAQAIENTGNGHKLSFRKI